MFAIWSAIYPDMMVSNLRILELVQSIEALSNPTPFKEHKMSSNRVLSVPEYICLSSLVAQIDLVSLAELAIAPAAESPLIQVYYRLPTEDFKSSSQPTMLSGFGQSC